MNILILSCGTRYKLVEYFKENGNGYDKVVATDCSQYAPALYIADKFYIVSRITSEGYIDELIEICRKEKIDIVLPLQEDELLFIAENKIRFESIGVFVAISEYSLLKLCKDKYNMYKYLTDNKIPTINTQLVADMVNNGDISNVDVGEMFVKPRYGAGSIGTMKVSTGKLLEALYKDLEDELIVQPYIKGKEYGVDVYVDYISSDVKAIFCKKKLRMRAGETEKSVSVKIQKIEELVKKTVGLLNLKGAVDMDVIENNGEYYILEINPRFGGGYPHAYECGVNFPKMMAINCRGRINDDSMLDYDENITALKYTDLIMINGVLDRWK